MFGTLSHLLSTPGPSNKPPKDVPPATPVSFPQCYPQAGSHGTPAPISGPRKTLTAVLQDIIRPTEINLRHLEALGVHVQPDSEPADIIPDPAFLPDFAKWDSLSYEEARAANEDTRRRLNTGGLSPGVQTYLDRKNEMLTENNAAFRAVRRIQPPPGQNQVRLGNSYEFFRNLESFATFWDDTSAPKPPTPVEAEQDSQEDTGPDEGEKASAPSQDGKESNKPVPPIHFFRSEAGTQMPPEFRLNILTSFLKLVAYDFGCNVSAPRTEPRLYLNAPPSAPASPSATTPSPNSEASQRSSYFSSGCTFIFRSPQTREAARAGIVEGPLAAVSARHTTTFPQTPSPGVDPETAPDRDSTIDLARELVAALLTAQHRAREGRSEKRFGDGAWWATRPRWGGGPGGPIGRETGAAPNTDEAVPDTSEGPGPAITRGGPGLPITHRPSSSSKAPAAKKPRKNLAVYDNYRTVRAPSSSWDKKTRYSAIGHVRGADYDDIFVISSLFHHVAIVRVRVPLRLLEVLDGVGGDDDDDGTRSWGRLAVVRSRWFDLFQAAERIAAMQLVWGMMAFLMRKEDEDVKMS